MYIKEIKYSGLNGLNNTFFFSKHNIFEGSNGVGKTTTLDAISIMLTGESLTYGKKIEKHLSIYDSKKIEIEMKLNTGIKQINEENEEVEIEPVFTFKMTPTGTKSWYVNGTKKTVTEYMDILYKWFKIPSEYYNLKSVEFVKMIMRPEQIEKEDSSGLYDFIKKLIGVDDLSTYQGLNKYDLIITNLAENNYNVDETIKQLKSLQNNEDKNVKSYEADLEKIEEQIDEVQKSFDGNKYNKNVDDYNNFIESYNNLTQEIDSLNSECESEKKQTNSDLIVKINQGQEQVAKKYNVLNEIKLNKDKLERDIIYFENNIKNCELNISALKESLLKNDNQQFNAIICEHCGSIANENQKQKFIREKNEMSEALKSEIKNNQNAISLYNSSLKQCHEDLELIEKEIQKDTQEINDISKENMVLVAKTNEDFVFSKKDILEAKIQEQEDIKKKINDILVNGRLQETSQKIQLLNNYQNQKEMIEKIIEKANSNINDFIQKQSFVEKLKNEYAQFVENRTNEVFGDIDFSLVKENKTNSKNKINIEAIKNGKGMSNYNTGDKILLQFEIINKVKQRLGIVGLPFIIDITDNIDSKNLENIFNICEGQFFGTRVVSESKKLTLNKEI